MSCLFLWDEVKGPDTVNEKVSSPLNALLNRPALSVQFVTGLSEIFSFDVVCLEQTPEIDGQAIFDIGIG